MPLQLKLSAVLLLLIVAQAGATVIPSEPQYVISLDGIWRFKLEQSDPTPTNASINSKQQPIRLPEHFEPFEKPGYMEDSSWHDLTVPGNWEMSGYSVATYQHPDNAIGLYRLIFDVPADWQGRIVKLNFDGVQNGAEIYLNGQPVNVDEPWGNRPNYHEGGYDAFQADLTPAVKFGKKNILAIRVYKNTNSVDLDTGDYFFLGGIHRSVTLFSVDLAHLEDVTLRTHLLEDGKAEVSCLVDLPVSNTAGKVIAQLEDEAPVETAIASNAWLELKETVEHPRLWSAEHPNLYNLSVDLVDLHGHIVEHLEKRIGIREITIKDGVLLVNHQIVKLTGMCRHDLDPALGSACNETVWRRDLALMRAANVNAVRTSHYPYGSGFYDLCDEMGFYVADEMAACWVSTKSDALTPAFAQHARELVRRDKNHPSVIIWAIGNENSPGKNNVVAAEQIRKLDPTRPRLVSTENAETAGVELDDAHYPAPSRVAADVKAARRSSTPQIYLENPNVWEVRNGVDYGCLDLWAGVMDRSWKSIWNDDHMTGSFLWEWRDRAVADPGPIHLYDYDSATGINVVKVKGLCDAFGNPRADYYHVKMVYAPIKIDLQPEIAGSVITVHAENHFSFTDVSELNTTWHLIRNQMELAHATVHPSLAQNSKGNLVLQLPQDALSQADALRLDFDHADGLNIVTYLLRLSPEKLTPPTLDPAGLKQIFFPHLNLVTVNYHPNHDGWHWAFRHEGQLTDITIQRPRTQADVPITANELYTTPLSAIESLDADVMLPDLSGDAVAHVHADNKADEFSYKFSWTGRAVDIQELGWAFSVTKDQDHFSWHRKAYWSWYPDNHIGRPQGTATPDSADVHITKIIRPDAFDFNSTKYNCDWASLTQASGHGLAVIFGTADQHDCRGDLGPGGNCKLIVDKQASPPRDISSSVVPELYLTIKKGESVIDHFAVGIVLPPRSPN